MTIRDLFDAGGPHAPESAKAWGEAISDAVDSGTNVGDATPLAPGTAAAGTATDASREDHVHPRQTDVTGAEMASGVSTWWFDAGADASAARPAGAAATDIVIWTNTPSEPTNLGARDQWEDAS